MNVRNNPITIAPPINELNIHQFALSCTNDFTWHWDIDSGAITLFGCPLKHLGYDIENNQTHIDFWLANVHVHDQTAALHKIKELIKGITPNYSHQYRLKNQNGEWALLHSSAKIYDYHPDGRSKSVVGHERLLDKEKQFNAKLKDLSDKYIHSLSGKLDTVWEWDLTTDEIYVSDVWKEDTFGVDKASTFLFKKHWSPRVHIDDLESMDSTLIALLKGECEYFNNEHRIQFNDGQDHWCLIRGSVYERDNNGRVLKLVGILTDISTQKQNELEKQQLLEQFSTTMHSTNSSCVEYNLKKSIYEHISFEIENKKIIQHKTVKKFSPSASTIHPDDHATVKQFYNSLLDNNANVKQAKWRSKYKGSGYKWFETTTRAVEHDKNGKPVRVLGIRQNIDEAYKLEQASVQTHAREETAYKDTFHCVWEWNMATGDLLFSDHFINKISDTPSTWNHTLTDWEACVHPDDLPIMTEQLAEQLSNEQPYIDITYRLRSTKGNWVWVKGEGNIIEFDNLNKPIRAVGTIIEITDLKQAEFALELEKKQAETTLESINEAVITTNRLGEINTINRNAEKFFRINKNEAMGKRLIDLCSLTHEDVNMPLIDYIELCMKSDLANKYKHLILTNTYHKKHYIDLSISPLHNNVKEVIGSVIVIRDVTSARKMSHEIEHRAQHDALTNLFNRHAFESALENSISKETYQHILCYIDLDQFKIVNDTCGHIAGDELLRQLASELANKVRKSDTLARLGGDEFGILIKDCDIDSAFKIASTIKKSIVDYIFHWEDKTFKLGASIGLATIDTETMPTIAMQHADTACFSAKSEGRNRIHVYRPDDDAMKLAKGQMNWVPRIQEALEKNHFELYVQAIVDLKHPNNEPTHFEVLVRLFENDKIIPPSAFLPAAERYNLSTQIDKWVISNTLETLNTIEYGLIKNDTYNINLSAPSLSEYGFLDFIKHALSTSNIQPSQICFEITETAAVTNLTTANSFITALKKMGCKFALDDFGSGLSSFGYLKNFSVDYLKIDGSFVIDITSDPIDAAMVKSINEIGQIMGKKTVAEWVENQAIADILIDIGVDYAQGYHYSKPIELKKLLANR
jgi:diguanylate cyclase (GGDEF)-like protein/PAS domain S-box-containing protein